MKQSLRAGILGAGLGSRLRSRSKAKPLAAFGEGTLLSRLIQGLREGGTESIHCALREELLSPDDQSRLPRGDFLSYLFVNTESSLHTLVELIEAMDSGKGPALFSMADTVLKPADLQAFLGFCSGLREEECAVLVTPYVDDEKPLWVHASKDGKVKEFSAEPGDFVTSGMYYLQPQAMEIAKKVLHQGTHKMRNFLSALAAQGIPIKVFVVSKTIDVDHPSDLDKAADFLRGD